MTEGFLSSVYDPKLIQQVLYSDLVSDSAENAWPTFLRCENYHCVQTYTDRGCRIKYYTSEERQSLIDSKCNDFFDATADTDSHAQRLDDVFSALIECQWRPKKQTPEDIIRETHQFFSRMPSVVLELPDSLSSLPLAYFDGSRKSWDCLRVVSFPCQNLVRMVLHGVMSAPSSPDIGAHLTTINLIAEIIDRVALKSTFAHSNIETQRWFIVRVFLWSFWQRARTISLHFTLHVHLRWGFGHNTEQFDWVRNFLISPSTSMNQLSEKAAEEGKPANMCSWAFRLLRTDAAAIGLNFSLFHRRFSAAFGQVPARCRAESERPCDGNHYGQCLRFVGQIVEDQTAHDSSCSYRSEIETRLIWDETSYNAVNGSRAVSITDSDTLSGRLRYCAASERTLAISHVWSHGQGGRPETGINSCLHMRYCRLANEFSCDSYWIDTCSIPTDHKLRKEAISHINGTFYKSRAVLICDKDLMKIDVTNITIPLQESLLVALLMCDWNIRAWTILEATKGREKIFLLCKDEKIVDFRKLVLDVYHHGNVAISVFATFVPHMYPWSKEGKRPSKTETDGGLTPLSVAEVGTWLSHRPASRPGDDVVIWSLLLGPGRQHYDNGADFWKALVGKTVPTGFLVSSSPRLTSPGLTWAPKSPFVAPERPRKSKFIQFADFVRPSGGQNTESAKIEKDGLLGSWLVYKFESRLGLWMKKLKLSGQQPSSEVSPSSRIEQELGKIRHHFLPHGIHGALLRPKRTEVYESVDRFVQSRDVTEQGTMVVVCGTGDQDWNSDKIIVRWEWKGLYKWPATVELPCFGEDREFWIG